MSEQAFAKAAYDLMTSVGEAFDKPAKLPAFILLYSSVDILASLARPTTQEDTTGAIFKGWVKKYMIANGSFAWNEEDIWGARCGLLHTYTVQSRSSRGGDARELHYLTNAEAVTIVQRQIDPSVTSKVFVFLPELINAFIDGVMRFTADVQKDSVLRATVFHHAAKLIVHDAIPNSALSGGK